MKILYLGLLLAFLWLFQAQPVYAQIAPTPVKTSPSPQPEQTSKTDANDTIAAIKNFVSSTDTLLGGFIFYTPDLFGNTITLKDGTALPGLTTFRDIFYAIAIPVIAIAISYFAIQRLKDETPYAFKALITKLLLVAILFIVTPPLLSYSIQANNLLVQKITSEQNFSQFITNFLDNEQEQIQKGADPQQFGIPNTQPVFLGGIVQSFWKFLLQSALFLITLFFFLIGFLFIAFQFIIRFASLLFLSVLFPIAIPFMLSEKTEKITNMYFKTWFTFLIHQPAFALGYMLVTGFLTAVLAKNGASLGMLFFYSGFLFFLGGVNTLVSSIFGSSWTAVGSNIGASMMAAPFHKSSNEFKRGITGGTSLPQTAGLQLRTQAGRGFGAIKSQIAKYKQDGSSEFSRQGAQKSQGFVKRQNLEDLIKDSNTPLTSTSKNSQPKGNNKQNGAASANYEEFNTTNPKKNKQPSYTPQPESPRERYTSATTRSKTDENGFEPIGKNKKRYIQKSDQGMQSKIQRSKVTTRKKGTSSQDPL